MSNDCDSPLVPSPGETVGWECSQPPSQSIEEGFEKHSEESSTAGGTLSGYDLVTRVLNHPEGGVGVVVRTDGQGGGGMMTGFRSRWQFIRVGRHPPDSKKLAGSRFDTSGTHPPKLSPDLALWMGWMAGELYMVVNAA